MSRKTLTRAAARVAVLLIIAFICIAILLVVWVLLGAFVRDKASVLAPCEQYPTINCWYSEGISHWEGMRRVADGLINLVIAIVLLSISSVVIYGGGFLLWSGFWKLVDIGWGDR